MQFQLIWSVIAGKWRELANCGGNPPIFVRLYRVREPSGHSLPAIGAGAS